jgi:DtxR family Mn-dependent transcriptional regulator
MKILTLLIAQSSILIFSGLLILTFILWFFWPKKGLLTHLSTLIKNNQRVLLEDALKYLFDCEYNKHTCNMDSLAGNLNISNDKTGQLIERLISMGLITLKNQDLLLTDTGRSYSLRVIRIHRVWERYLADETSIAQADWHKKADRLEHIVTPEDTERIAARIGNPVYDPHGDPIPSIDGAIPEHKGIPLNQLKKGTSAHIIHIEDEPRSIYEQLTVQGLYPGMQVYVTDVEKNKITFAANSDECTLTTLFAAQITVELASEANPITPSYRLLSDLDIGQQAEIAGISPNCRGQQRRRLMDMGIVPGSLISAQLKSASGDPIGFRVMGTTIGIRKQQADLIFIHKTDNHD